MPKSSKYATTLPVSKENAILVKLYCTVRQIPAYEFVNKLIENELAMFRTRVEKLRRTG